MITPRGIGFLCVLLLVVACGGGITPIQTAFNKGAYQYSTGNYEMAVSEYREAVTENPEDLKARFNLGIALEAWAAQGGAEIGSASRVAAAANTPDLLRTRAREHYEFILTRVPNHARATVNLAAMDAESDNLSGAEQRLRSLLAAEEGGVLARTSLAALLINQGRIDEAEPLLVEAESMDSGNTAVNGLLGDVRSRQGRAEDARASYQKVLAKDPDSLFALMALAQFEAESKNWAAAKEHLKRVFLLQPRHYAAHLMAADVSEALEDWEDAVWYLWQARDLRGTAPKSQSEEYFSRRLNALYAQLQKAQ